MLSKAIEELVGKLKTQKSSTLSALPEDSLINVNKITEKTGVLYEKIRYMVDYKEEKNIRRNAVERIIKRKIIFEGEEGIGLSLIQELIAGGYLANKSIAERVAFDLERIIRKYAVLEQSLPQNFRNEPKTRATIVSILSSEIEAFFYPNNEDELVADAFYATVKSSIQVESDLNEQGVKMVLLASCYRSLLNADNETLLYRLWLKYNPGWLECSDEISIVAAAQKAPELLSQIKTSLKHPLGFKLVPKLSNYAIYFSIIREIVRAYGAESDQILANEASRNQFISEFLEKNYKKQYQKALGSAVRAVIYIFLTKIVLALALEVPYQIYFLKEIEYLPITTNVLLHPVLLLVMTLSVRKLGEKNTKRVSAGVESVLSEKERRPVRVTRNDGGFFNIIFYVLYAVMFFIVFGVIITILQGLNFSIVSIGLFLCFLALVSYFALRIRHSANIWRVTGEDDKIMNLIFNLFALPIIRMGRWLSQTFSSINLFVFVLDFIIETPFKLMLKFSDAFLSFLKDKQEDVY